MEFKSDTEKLGNVIQQIVERLEKLETANKRSKQTRKFKTLMPCSPDHLLRGETALIDDRGKGNYQCTIKVRFKSLETSTTEIIRDTRETGECRLNRPGVGTRDTASRE